MSYEKNTLTYTSRGFTLVEILIVISVVGIMASVVLYNFSAKRNTQVLSNTEDEVVALVSEARSRTVSAEENMQYGVHFQSNRVVLFQGATFVDGAGENREISIDPVITITSIALAGSSTDVVFKKMTGETDTYGSLVIKNTSSFQQKTITISRAGFVSGN